MGLVPITRAGAILIGIGNLSTKALTDSKALLYGLNLSKELGVDFCHLVLENTRKGKPAELLDVNLSICFSNDVHLANQTLK